MPRTNRRATDRRFTVSTIPWRRIEAERLASAVTALAAMAALAVSLAFPVSYFLAAHDRVAAVTELRANIYASVVSDDAGQNPQLWNALLSTVPTDLSDLEIASPDDPKKLDQEPERRRVFARDGHLLLSAPMRIELQAPTITRRAPVLQNGNILGQVEIQRSLRPAVIHTLAIGAISLILGLLLLVVLRIVPLRLMRKALERASYLSAHDQLTGLPNRVVLIDCLEHALEVGRRTGAPVAMLFLDLDHFKEVNDSLGHGAGDVLLREVSKRLHACIRASDTLARLGGDEFAVVQCGSDRRAASALANRLITAIREPVSLDGQYTFVGLSIGIALSTAQSDSAELIKQADMALYEVKRTGRGTFCFFSPEMNTRLQRRRSMEYELRSAVENGELTLHYQPQIAIATGKIVGAEALMRWRTPAGEWVPPAAFIPLAEDTGLIGQIGAWVINSACCEAIHWPAEMKVSVNVSPVQFRLPDFLETVRCALTTSGLHPQRLELEVTEGILLNDAVETLDTLACLRILGVRLVMDDFGTGYASLSYLQRFRFDKIKIDRTFVQGLGNDPNATAIVRAVVGLSDALGMSSNAEGVENDTQVAILRAHGCQEAQGYHYWRPMPAEELRRLIQSPNRTPQTVGSVAANVPREMRSPAGTENASFAVAG
jgi:diguanylate cyclase (GGDEF)-like protein